MQPTFFATPEDWRGWLAGHHADEKELLVGFHKKVSGNASLTWPESVDEALCFGWIDGVRRRIDEARYSIRFTPRKARSIWSAVNIGRVEELTRAGRMQPAGLRAFAAREESRSKVYSFEQAEIELDPAQKERFEADLSAWEFFASRGLSYRRAAIWWVINAKRAETSEKRLAALIEDSRNRRTLAHLTPTPAKRKG